MPANLPNELVRHILQFLPKGKYYDCFTVCKKWKEIILSPSILWRHLNLSEEVLEKLSDQQLQTLLDRSVGPFLEKLDLCFLEDESINRQVLASILKWKSLPIKKLGMNAKVLPNFPEFAEFARWCKTGLPSLHSVSLEPNLPISFVQTLMYLPTVENISLTKYANIKLEKAVELKSLALNSVDELTQDFFEKVKGLECFHLTDSYIQDPNSLDCSKMIEFRMYNLKTSSGFVYSYFLQYFYKLIKNGVLEVFDISYCIRDFQDYVANAIMEFKPRLKHLNLGFELNSEDLKSILLACPLIEWLSVQTQAIDVLGEYAKQVKTLYIEVPRNGTHDFSLLSKLEYLNELIVYATSPRPINLLNIKELIVNSGRRWNRFSITTTNRLSEEEKDAIRSHVAHFECIEY